MNSYKRWVLRQARTAQCSPALMVLGMLIAAAITIYIYREVIIQTLIIAGIAVGIICGSVLVLGLALNGIRWHRRRTAAAIQASPVMAPEAIDATEGTMIEAKAISDEADWLAAEGVELAFSPDGKTLKVKDS